MGIFNTARSIGRFGWGVARSPVSRTAMKYVGAPALLAGGMYALGGRNRDAGPDTERMLSKERRSRDALMLGGALAGGMLGHRGARAFMPGGVFKPGFRLRAAGTLGGALVGGLLATHFGVPAHMAYELKKRRAQAGYPEGVDPSTGLSVNVGPQQVAESPASAQFRSKWGF